MTEKIDVSNEEKVILKKLDEIKKAQKTAMEATQVLWNLRIDAMLDTGINPKDVLSLVACNADCCGCGCCCSDTLIGIDRNQLVINELNQKVLELNQEVSILQGKIK